jgi:hypothetical protein
MEAQAVAAFRQVPRKAGQSQFAIKTLPIDMVSIPPKRRPNHSRWKYKSSVCNAARVNGLWMACNGASY